MDCDEFEQRIALDIEMTVEDKMDFFKEIFEFIILSELI